jgi:hypothetical protein
MFSFLIESWREAKPPFGVVKGQPLLAAYWLVVAGTFVPMPLVIAGVLVISTAGLLVLLFEAVGGSLAAELVELD